MRHRLFIVCLLSLCCTAASAHDELCDTSAMLAKTYDSVMAMELETDEMRQQAAITLLAIVIPSVRHAEIVANLAKADIPADIERLERILQFATHRARNTISGISAETITNGSPRALDMDWLADLILATGCVDDWAGMKSFPEAHDLKGLTADTVNSLKSRTFEIALAAGLILLLGLGFTIRKSRMFRAGELRSQPRNAVALPATASIADADDPISLKVVDLSVGGAKVAWADPPEKGQKTTLKIDDQTIPSAIIWRNDFYAGLLFDSQLTQQRLDELVHLNNETAAGK